MASLLPDSTLNLARDKTILVVDDSRTQREIIANTVMGAFPFARLLCAENGEEAVSIVKREHPSIVLMDWVMSGMSGVEACSILSKTNGEVHGDNPFVRSLSYIVIMTTRRIDSDIIEAFSCGADDFIRKPPKIEELAARIGVGLRMVTANKAVIEQQKSLEFVARIDKLTGLYNRKHIDDTLEVMLALCIRNGRGFSVGICDIDNFKQVNDTYGHLFGDIVLSEMAKLFRDNIRSTDIVGRWGGDEFFFIFPETSKEGATQVVKRIRNVVKLAAFSVPQECKTPMSKKVNVYMSLGIAGGIPKSREDLLSMIKRADTELYAEKTMKKIPMRKCAESSDSPTNV